MKKFLLLILIALFPVFFIAQDGWKKVQWEDFEKTLLEVGQQYTIDTYSVNIRYSTFKGVKSTIPFETSIGYFQKSKNYTQTSILGVTTIEDRKHKITLDSINKVIALNNSNSSGSLVDVEQYKKTKSMIEFIKVKEKSMTNTFLIKYNSNSPISKTELTLTKSNELKSIIVYYAKPKQYIDENGDLKEDYLWLKMDYFNFSKNIRYKVLKKSFLMINKGDDYILTSRYKMFRFADLRYKK